MKPKSVLKNLLKQSGIEISKYPGSLLKKRMQLFDYQGINLVFDIGANVGQYASLLRRIGYQGRIISFEPLGQAYSQLAAQAKPDPLWEAVHLAIGDESGEIEINVSGGNTTSSSILDMLPAHLETKPEAAYVGKETVGLETIDRILGKYYQGNDRLLLKVDTQGYERQVLAGAEASWAAIHGIQLELSLVELYEGEMLYDEMIAYLQERGFSLHFVEPGFTDPKNGRLLQMDGIFFRD